MRIQAINNNFVRNNGSLNRLNNKSMHNNITFSAGEDYGCDLDAPENPEPTNKPGFKKGLLGVVTALTFPVSVPTILFYEKYKDDKNKNKDKDQVKTNMNYDNIKD